MTRVLDLSGETFGRLTVVARAGSTPGRMARVTAANGPIAGHRCVDCSGPAAEWSYDKADEDELRDERGRVYSLKPEHYVARCVRCHRRFDGNFPTVA